MRNNLISTNKEVNLEDENTIAFDKAEKMKIQLFNEINLNNKESEIIEQTAFPIIKIKKCIHSYFFKFFHNLI